MKLHRVILATFAEAALLPAIAWAQSPAATDGVAAVVAIQQSLIEAIARAEPSVVAISRASAAEPTLIVRGLGDVFGDIRQDAPTGAAVSIVAAGVIIDRTGLVLTEYLAVREGDRHTITTVDGTTYPATIKAADPRSGLAILAIDPPASSPQRTGDSGDAAPGSFPAIRFGDAAQLRKGQFVVAIGNPFAIQSDGQPTASWGIVANLARKAPPGTNLNDAPGPYNDHRTTLHHLGTLIQTDAKLGWSAGGGALVNLQGELVGLTTTAATIAGHEQPAGYAIPINAAFRRIIDTLKEGREVEYGLLGVSFGPAPPETATGTGSRLNVLQVFPGSPAARGGLAAGDVVTRIAGQPVGDIDAVQLAVSLLPPSATTTIEYQRRGQTATAQVSLAKLAVAGKKIVTQRADGWRGIRVDYATALDAVALAQAAATGTLDAEGCVLVTEVVPDSEAWLAGVRPGMFISHVGAQRVTTPAEFHAATPTAGDKLDIRLTKPIEPPADAEPADQPVSR